MKPVAKRPFKRSPRVPRAKAVRRWRQSSQSLNSPMTNSSTGWHSADGRSQNFGARPQKKRSSVVLGLRIHLGVPSAPQGLSSKQLQEQSMNFGLTDFP